MATRAVLKIFRFLPVLSHFSSRYFDYQIISSNFSVNHQAFVLIMVIKLNQLIKLSEAFFYFLDSFF